MTEAMISGSLLHNDILDGNSEKLKNSYSKSLPTNNKGHIFDGLDVSFIERDILKGSRRMKSARFMESSAGKADMNASRSLAVSPFGARIPRTDEISMQKKYRDYEKKQKYEVSLTQLTRHPPPIKLRCREIPTSYNEFLTMEGRVQHAALRPPLPEITLSSIRLPSQLESRETCPDLQKVQEHVERVKELLGKKARSSQSRGGAHAHMTIACSLPTQSDRRKLVSRRIRTVGPEVLGSWNRAGSSLSTAGLN